jgi:type IV pilus assembly protein PilY1
VSGASSNLGERSVSDSVVRGKRVLFSTLVPDPDACNFGGSGWLMELDAATGSSLAADEAPFLVKQGTSDYVGVTIDHDNNPSTSKLAPGGRRSQIGIIPTPAVVARPGGRREYKYLSGSQANSQTKLNLEVVVESADASMAGRQSWSQLFRQ